MDIQEYEEQQHGRDGIWAGGVLCATYEEACHVTGCDTADDIAYEQAYYAAIESNEALDDVEIRGATYGAYAEFSTYIDW